MRQREIKRDINRINDFITSCEVIIEVLKEHIKVANQSISELNKLLKPQAKKADKTKTAKKGK